MLFQYVFKGFYIGFVHPKRIEGVFFNVFIERSFSVEFQILEHIYFIDDLPELVLYIGSSKDPGGML